MLNASKLKTANFQPISGILPGNVFLIMVSVGFLLRFNYLIGLSFIAGAISLNRMLVSKDHLGFMQLPFWLMVIVVPIPFLNEVSGYMSFAVSKTVAFILGVIFPLVEVDGISVVIPGGVSFDIGTDCSGAGSILALISIVILWLASFKDNPKITYVLIALALPVGFFTNVLRIVFIFMIAGVWGMQSAIKLWHDFAGYMFYIISLGILFIGWMVMKRISKDEIRLRRLIIA
jgi:exosortase/archaeosortase family protein